MLADGLYGIQPSTAACLQRVATVSALPRCQAGEQCRVSQQVADQLRRDPRLVVMERTNLRHLTPPDLGGPPPDLVTLDLSFISVLTVLPAVAALMAPAAELVSLIKPQFEARREQVGAHSPRLLSAGQRPASDTCRPGLRW